jgi:anti-sigma factor RsiW
MTPDPVSRPKFADWQLERYRLDELPAEETRMVDEALARDAALRKRLQWLDESDAEVLRRHPPAAVAAALRVAGVGSARPRPARPRIGSFLAAAAAALVVGVGTVVLVPRLGPRDAADATRVKGLTPYLLVYRQAATERVERLEPGTLAHDHDRVQLAYQAGGRRYGVIVSVDGRGVITRHLPVDGSEAVPLKPGPPVPLPDAYELDDAPRFERFYFVTSDEPFAVDRVMHAVRLGHRGANREAQTGGARLDLPGTMEQFSFVLEKESRR